MADLETTEPAELSDAWIPEQPPTGEGPDPDIDHPEPSDPPAEPKSYGLEDIWVTAESGTAKTLGDWLSDGEESPTVSCVDTADHAIVFDFDDPTGHPRDVVVYTAGRPE